MRIAMVTFAAMAAVMFAAPSFAEVQPTPPPGDQIVCKLQPQASGSNLGMRRICMTKNQWDDARREGRQTVEEAQSHSLRANDPGR